MRDVQSNVASSTPSLWVKELLAPAALRDACSIQFPVAPNGTALGSWQLCCAVHWPKPPEGCLAVSIGIGGDLFFESAIAGAGCSVHAFDPTMPLRSRHEAMADQPINHRIRFYYLGLGTRADAAAHKTQPGRLPYGALATHRLASLDRLLDLATAGRERKTIDVLKLDCEGCEWRVLSELARERSNALSKVRMLLIELHLTEALGGPSNGTTASELAYLMSYLEQAHGFRLYKRRLNSGYSHDKKQIGADLIAAGFPSRPCCAELHFVRASEVDEASSQRPCDFGVSPDWERYPELYSRMAPPYSQGRGARIVENDELYSNPRLNRKQARGGDFEIRNLQCPTRRIPDGRGRLTRNRTTACARRYGDGGHVI